MSGRKSRQKGKRGEREAARVLTTMLGIPVVRGVQFAGSPDSPDLKGLSDVGLHPEVKRDEITISPKVQRLLTGAGGSAVGEYGVERFVIVEVKSLSPSFPPIENLPTIKVTKPLWTAMEQATRDSGGLVPFVMCKRNRQPWYFVIKVSDYSVFCSKIEETRG